MNLFTDEKMLLTEEPTSPQMNLIVTNVVSHAETPPNEEELSPLTEEEQNEGTEKDMQTQDGNLNGVNNEVFSAAELEKAEDDISKEMQENLQEVESDSQSEAQEVLDESKEQREEPANSQEVSSETCNESNAVEESSKSSERDILQKGCSSNPSSPVNIDLGSTDLEELQDTAVESEFQNSNISEQVDESDAQDGGVGALTITSVGTLHGDITDENAIEAMETDHSDEAIISNSNSETATEKNEESMEITENEESLLKEDDEGNFGQDMEEVDEDSLLKEKETEDEGADKGDTQQIVEEKLGECAQDEVVSSSEIAEPLNVSSDVELTEPLNVSSDVERTEPLKVSSNVELTEPLKVSSDVELIEPLKVSSDLKHTESISTEPTGGLEDSGKIEDGNSTAIESEKQESTSDSTKAEEVIRMEADVEPTESKAEVEKSEVAESVKSDEKSNMTEEKSTGNPNSASVVDPVSGELTESTAENKQEKPSEPPVEDVVMIDDKDDSKGRYTADRF